MVLTKEDIASLKRAYADLERACNEYDCEPSFAAWRDSDSDAADEAAEEVFDLLPAAVELLEALCGRIDLSELKE